MDYNLMIIIIPCSHQWGSPSRDCYSTFDCRNCLSKRTHTWNQCSAAAASRMLDGLIWYCIWVSRYPITCIGFDSQHLRMKGNGQETKPSLCNRFFFPVACVESHGPGKRNLQSLFRYWLVVTGQRIGVAPEAFVYILAKRGFQHLFRRTKDKKKLKKALSNMTTIPKTRYRMSTPQLDGLKKLRMNFSGVSTSSPLIIQKPYWCGEKATTTIAVSGETEDRTKAQLINTKNPHVRVKKRKKNFWTPTVVVRLVISL